MPPATPKAKNIRSGRKMDRISPTHPKMSCVMFSCFSQKKRIFSIRLSTLAGSKTPKIPPTEAKIMLQIEKKTKLKKHASRKDRHKKSLNRLFFAKFSISFTEIPSFGFSFCMVQPLVSEYFYFSLMSCSFSFLSIDFFQAGEFFFVFF